MSSSIGVPEPSSRKSPEAVRKQALTDAADYAEFYANERMTLCGDATLHDPVLGGGLRTTRQYTREEIAKSRDLQIDGTIHSAAYHAAMQIAEHLRALATGGDQ